MSPKITLVTFGGLDYVILALFIGAILALGFSARLRDNSVLQYLAAGRSLSLPAFVATLVTTWYGGILGISESVSFYGVGTWLLTGVPYYVFAIAYALWFARKVRGADQLSIPERLHLRWGKGVGVIAALLVFSLAVPSAHVLMLGTLVQSCTGWATLPAVAVGAIVGTLFLWKGGLLADVRVAMLAFVMMYIGFLTIDIYCLTTHPLPTILPMLQAQNMTNFTGGKGGVVVLGFFILGAWTLVDPGFHQRVTSSAAPEIGRRGVFVSTAFWLLFDVLSITAALYAVALANPKPEDAKLLFPAFGSQILPSGLRAVFFCGMLGTILSAMVGYALVSGATFGRELVARLRPEMPEGRITLWCRLGTAIGCLVGVGLALGVDSVVGLWYAWGGCAIGALLIPVCLAYLQEGGTRIRPFWIAASMLAAFGLSALWLAYSLKTGNAFQNLAIIQGSSGLRIVAEAESATPVPGRIDFPLGTMIPSLLIAALTLMIGRVASSSQASATR